MPTFSYIALDTNNNQVSNTIEKLDRSGVISALTQQGLRPISIKETKSKTTTIKKLSNKNKIKSDQLVMFTRQLSAMVGAGVPLLRALSSLSEHITENPVLKKILDGVIHDIEAGSTLGDALDKYPNTFNDVYVNMVRAGEAAGILDEILNRLAMQQEKSSSLRRKIKSAMAYPLILLLITVFAFFGLMIFIIPQIGKVVTDLGGGDAELPTLTLVMLGISSFITSYWYIIFVVIGVVIYGTLKYTKTPRGRFQRDTLLLKVPILKTTFTKVAIAHFARTFSALIEAGVDVLEALDVTSRAVGNVVYEKALKDAEAEVKIGKSLSSAIITNPLFPPIVSQMLLVGEETGQTDKILIKVADFFEEEVDTAINGLSTVIEPVMIVIMGGMVGLIAASVMLPIAGLAQNIK
jgi:type IV pilus assembly protein PilC